MNKNSSFSKKNCIDIFDFAADIFAYPDENWIQKVKFIYGKSNLTLNDDINLEKIRADYINYFDINSTKFKTTLIASYWIDGAMMGASSDKISKFYKECGFCFDAFGTSDHLSNMLAFCAILIQNDMLDELRTFKKYLTWCDDLLKSISKYDKLIMFQNTLKMSINVLKIY